MILTRLGKWIITDHVWSYVFITLSLRVFHILPDDTATSAIWAAQRVPDNHISVIANQFVIGEIDLDDKKNFMYSKNMLEVAIRNNLWSPQSSTPFHFSSVYGTDRHKLGSGCTRRVWRVFTLAAPSLKPILSGYTDGLQTFGYGADFSQPYPFSVQPDRPLTVQDVMNMNRDQFEGTDFDLTKGTDSLPFGDPMRYAPRSALVDPVDGVTRSVIYYDSLRYFFSL